MNKNKLPLVLILFFLTHTIYVISGTTPPQTPSSSPSQSPTPEAAPSATFTTPPTTITTPHTDSSSSHPLSPDSSPAPLPTSSMVPGNSPEPSHSPQAAKIPDESIKKEEDSETKGLTHTEKEEKTHPPHQSRYVYSSVHVSEPYIAITFDDGPHASLTPKLLDMLKARGIKATFFLIGENVAQHPNIVKRMVKEGHEVANHTWSHPSLTKCSPEKFNREIKAANEAIESAAGIRPSLIRPPYGATNANLDRIMNEKYCLKVILWSVDPMDWKYRNAERVAGHIPTHTKPGDIILAHDIHATTVEAMPKVLDALLAKGLKFLTVSELISHQTAVPPRQKKAFSSPEPQQGVDSSSPTHSEETLAPSPSSSPGGGSSSDIIPSSSTSPPSNGTNPVPLPAETPEP